MYVAEASLGGIGRALEIRAVGDVEFERQQVPGRGELGLGRRKMIFADVGNHDPHAGAEQRLGDTEADTTCAAGHERGFAGQILHVPHPLLIDGGCCNHCGCQEPKGLDKPPRFLLYLTHTKA